jgi:hypothetical protein
MLSFILNGSDRCVFLRSVLSLLCWKFGDSDPGFPVVGYPSSRSESLEKVAAELSFEGSDPDMCLWILVCADERVRDIKSGPGI